jgi:hypothetical protein
MHTVDGDHGRELAGDVGGEAFDREIEVSAGENCWLASFCSFFSGVREMSRERGDDSRGGDALHEAAAAKLRC